MLRRQRCSGVVMFYMIGAMVGFIAVCSIAVDYGRVQFAKVQLRSAADAAALAGASGLRNGPNAARKLALDYVGKNLPGDLKDAIVASTKVTFGYWGDPQDLVEGPDDEADLTDDDVDTDKDDDDIEEPDVPSVFTVLDAEDGRINALRVEIGRTANGGSAVPLIFASLLGQKTCDVHAAATAIGYTGGAGDGFVGIKKLKMHKQGYTDSYMSDWGPYGTYAPREHGSVLTNGKLKFKKDVIIHGDARPGIGKKKKAAKPAQGGTVTGSREPLDYILSYPPVELLPKKKPHPKPPKRGNFELREHESYTLTEGEYRYHDFKIKKDATLNIVGEVTLILDGKFEAKGLVKTWQNKPANLRIRLTGKKSVKIGKKQSLYADIYAPLGKAKVDKEATLYGAIIAKDLKVGDKAKLHYDESLFTRYTGSSLVQ